MQRYEDFPTHLGGDCDNLEWEDLDPHEILLAVGGAMSKAAAAIPLVEQQIAAVNESCGTPMEGRAYAMTLWALQRMTVSPRQTDGDLLK